MATITLQSIVLDVLEAEGWDGDFQWFRIYRYIGLDNGFQFALFNDAEHDDLDRSPYVRNPVLLMEAGELTEAGREFMAKEKTMKVVVAGDTVRGPLNEYVQAQLLTGWDSGAGGQSARTVKFLGDLSALLVAKGVITGQELLDVMGLGWNDRIKIEDRPNEE